MPKQIVFAIVIFLHDLFTVVWIGGLFTLGLIVLPATRRALGMGPQAQELMDTIQRRLRVPVYVSIVGLVATGLLLARRSPAFAGFFQFGTPYGTVLSLKHVLTILMIAVTLVRSVALPRINLAQPSRQRLKAALLFLNMALGVLVLLLSGFSAALSAGGPLPSG